MKNIFVHGVGAVSPAGWGVDAMRNALSEKRIIEPKSVVHPNGKQPFLVRAVPPPPVRPTFLNHGRLRRTSPITQFGVAAGMEALGRDAAKITDGNFRLGIVQCVMSGCINYSRRFYDETLRDPATASPLVFPETVFNAPASHLAALLGTKAINYTIIGDPGTFLQGMALAANWLLENRVDGCLVIGAEEADWLTADAFRRFRRGMILSEGAGAVYLRADSNQAAAQLLKITDAHPFLQTQDRRCAATKMRRELDGDASALLCDGTQNKARLDRAELEAWSDWPGERLSPKLILGEGLMAAAAWQCVAAIDALQQGRYKTANVSVVGCNQEAVGAQFIK